MTKHNAEELVIDLDDDKDEPTPAPTHQESRESRDLKPRAVSFYIQRAMARYLGPEIRDFAVACAAGRVQPKDVLPDIQQKLQIVAENVVRHGPIRKAEEIENIVPLKKGMAFVRLQPDVVRQILDMRREGHSKRSISKELKRPPQTITNVLNREGDPAPKDLLEREADIKRKTIAKLQKQIAELET